MTATTKVSRKTTTAIPFLLLLVCCSSIKQLSSAFVIRHSQITTPARRQIVSGSGSGEPSYKHSHSHPYSHPYLSATKEEASGSANLVLETLQKRLAEGDGSLTQSEINAAINAGDSLLEHLDDIQSSYEVKLTNAVKSLDADTVSTMYKAGYVMDERTTELAFRAAIHAIDDAEANDLPIPANATNMIHHIIDADMVHLLQREKIRTNVTCMQPDDNTGTAGAARKMNYVFDDGDHKNLPLMEGRRCEGGTCCDKCSRNIFPTFASNAESSLETFPELASLTFNDLEKVSSATIVQFIRLVERVRRTMAHEYGLPLKSLLPLQAYSRKYVAGTTQQGGGGGEGDFVTLHTDEATHEGYHYSCVIYLSTHNEDFEGGAFVFNDPAETNGEGASGAANGMPVDDDDEEIDDELLELLKRGELPDELPEQLVPTDEGEEEKYHMNIEEEIRRAGRSLTPFYPTRGSAVIFSSGWENMHEVEKITSGTRYAVPCFFTTCPVPEAAYDQMKVGKPQSDEDIADDWLHLLLAHRKEAPMESVGRVKELLMKWHYICTPLSMH